ncbi:alpha/beta hydrolase [Saccharothrix longispora]|uniref:Pimeloyl-ACP methyl ester carboxylesterase n=1 Tax=Saccharothrix longispora TaxID=33920 RepID=A0ABU1PTP3_9PSEU|nr:alpha/beta hydrolase [Saccharothrix longispora]MDR6594020.1 pimeloyl-ACP methyl ester carboxylesterase [Saccharothrix longispora]
MRTLLVTALTASLLVVAPPAQAATIAWQPCPEQPAAECGTVSVPLDWANPRGARVDLAVSRVRATDPARRIGVVFVDAGGPGGSGAEFAQAPYLSAEVRARFDVVGFDQLGTNNSSAIRCSPELMARNPGDDPTDEAGFAALARHNLAVRDECRARHPVFDHVDTARSARDLDAVRAALGERKISFYGISYGTLLGQQYAELFGPRVRSMVLDGVIDHSSDQRRLLVDRARALEEAFDAFVAWCAAKTACALHGRDVRAAWEEALVAADEIGLGQGELIEWAFFEIRGGAWGNLASLIADVGGARASFEPNYGSLRYAVVCQDFALRYRDFHQYRSLREAELRASPTLRGTPIGHQEAASCIGFTDRPRNPQHRLDVDQAPPLLLLTSRYDVATPYRWAVNVHRQAAGSRLVTFDGPGHGVYHANECTRTAADAHLLGTAPARQPNTTC